MNTDKAQLIDYPSVRIGAPSVADAVVPISRVPLSFRLATLDDVPAMDALQKRYNKALGYFKTEWFEGYIKTGGVLIAEQKSDEATKRRSDEGEDKKGAAVSGPSSLRRSVASSLSPRILGYCISRDQYLKRDELGIIYQLCVAPGEQRKLVGAALLREVFARSAYGCKLYCLWCAQDLDANYFWESMGFLPIAFRTGSKSKGPKGSARVHIFWQRRIREGDTTTPIWFPAKTSGGAMGEERLVLPIPPGTHWRDVMPVVLPGQEDRGSGVGCPVSGEKQKRLRGSSRNPEPETRNPRVRQYALLGPPPPVNAPQAEPAATPATPAAPKPKKPPRARLKNDPADVAMARELRDRYLEHVNSGQLVLESAGKYDVSRALSAAGPSRPLSGAADRKWSDATPVPMPLLGVA